METTQFTADFLAGLPLSLKRARDYALQAHGDQMYGDQPYISHLDHVLSILFDVQAPLPVCQAGWLHDVVEDTPRTADDIAAEFGHTVAGIVAAVSVDSNPDLTKRERYLACYDKLNRVGLHAAMVKVADRIANVEATILLWQRDPEKANIYRAWYILDFPHLIGAVAQSAEDSKKLTLLCRILVKVMTALDSPQQTVEDQLALKWAP
jgi:(p)ppGpp synthase/HD superfamily hydrolase